jgi:hypothetical protein
MEKYSCNPFSNECALHSQLKEIYSKLKKHSSVYCSRTFVQPSTKIRTASAAGGKTKRCQPLDLSLYTTFRELTCLPPSGNYHYAKRSVLVFCILSTTLSTLKAIPSHATKTLGWRGGIAPAHSRNRC